MRRTATIELPALSPPPLVLRRRSRAKAVTAKMAVVLFVLLGSLVIGTAVRVAVDGPSSCCAKAR